MTSPSTTSLLSKLQQRVRRWLANQKFRRDFDTIHPNDSERILRDVGLSMSDMHAITHPHAGPTTLLPQRLEALRLDPRFFETTDPALFKELQRNCLRCVSWRRCARDLARGDAQTGLNQYCVNAETIDAMLLGQKITIDKAVTPSE